jgi:hypothetical protein
MTHHYLAATGLALNLVGTLLVLAYPPRPVDGIGAPDYWSDMPKTPDARGEWIRRWQTRDYKWRQAFLLLIAGFAPQLIDLLIT